MSGHTIDIYPLEYFDLQLRFAREVAERLSLSFPDVLLEYTSLYMILGIEGDFDAAHPAWQSVLARADGPDAASWTHDFYRSRLGVIPRFTDQPHWGCFGYEYRSEYHGHPNAIHIHFSNQDDSGYGALSRQRVPARLTELAEMFGHIAMSEPQAATVCGGSWLYNREAYRRLFPLVYTLAPVADEPHYQFRALWGQFLRHTWRVNEELAASLLSRVKLLRDPQQLADCFPYQVLLVSCPISAFYSFYA